MAEQIEGSIVTDGAGVGGSRTRGGHSQRKPQARSLQTGGSPTLLTGRKLNRGAMGSVNTSGARVHAQPTKAFITEFAKEIPVISPSAIGQVGNMLSNSAMKFAERKAIATADDAVVYYEDQLRKKFYGDVDTGGKGYNSSVATEATSGYKPFSEEVEQTTADVIASLPEDARAKAMTRIQGTRRRILNLAADHAVKQQDVVEQNNKIKKYDSMARDLVVTNGSSLLNPAGGLVGGVYDRVLAMNAGDDKTAMAMVDSLAIAAAQKRYLSDIEHGEFGDALKNLKLFRENAKGSLTITAQTKMDEMVLKATSSYAHKSKHNSDIAVKQKKEKHDKSMNAASNFVAGYDEKGSHLKEPTNNVDAAALVARFPDISEKEAQDLVDKEAARKKKGSNIKSDPVGFSAELADIRSSTGTYYQDRAALNALGAKYNMKPSEVSAEWDSGRGVIKSDEVRLSGEVDAIYKELDRVFLGKANSTGISSTVGAVSLQDLVAGRKVKMSTIEMDTEYNRLRADIHSIWKSRTDLTPSQRSEEIRSYIETQIGKVDGALYNSGAGEPNKAQGGFNYNLDKLTEGYRVEHYMNQLDRIERSNASSYTEASGAPYSTSSIKMHEERAASENALSVMSFLSKHRGVSVTNEGYTKLVTSAAKKGIHTVHYVSGADIGVGGSWTGLVGVGPDGKLHRVVLKKKGTELSFEVKGK